jgi:hypothetical protein
VYSYIRTSLARAGTFGGMFDFWEFIHDRLEPMLMSILTPKIVAFQEPRPKKKQNGDFLENEFNYSL